MKLWEKDYQAESIVEQFTVGKDRELDQQLIGYDLQASKAHAQMLHAIGILNKDESESITSELDKMSEEFKKDQLIIEEEFEDMHSKIEYELINRLGDTGKKIHTGRSRNDQVLVCMHLYLKDEIIEIKNSSKRLFDLLIQLSNEHKEAIIPGYTHLQAAMPSSFGMWFSAYAESIIDDLILFDAAYKVADQNPLGSAAGYGSSFPLDRSMTTDLLSFGSMKYNSIAAQMSRGKVEKVMSYAMASLAGTISKLSMDVCLYMSQNFGFLSFPDELTTGSSIMPHKKNPDIFELARSKCNALQVLPLEIGAITSNLPSGYHRDLQLVKEKLVPSIDTLKSCIEIVTYALKEVRINTEVMDDVRYDFIYTVESVNKLVQEGVSFRDAYKIVGDAVQKGTYTPDKDFNHTHEGSIGNLCNDEIVEKFNSLCGGLN